MNALFALMILIIVLPISVNWLMGVSSNTSVEGPPEWIPFFGSYLGGLIGGIFTYLAMRYTLKDKKTEENNENENIERYFLRLSGNFVNEIEGLVQLLLDKNEEYKEEFYSAESKEMVFMKNIVVEVIDFKKDLKDLLGKTASINEDLFNMNFHLYRLMARQSKYLFHYNHIDSVSVIDYKTSLTLLKEYLEKVEKTLEENENKTTS